MEKGQRSRRLVCLFVNLHEQHARVREAKKYFKHFLINKCVLIKAAEGVFMTYLKYFIGIKPET